MKILYLGDIMGAVGVKTVRAILPKVKKEYQVDLVIAQAENVTNGKGLSKADFIELRKIGVDFCTGGNWSLHNPEIIDYLNDPAQPVIRPANYPIGTPGRGWKYIETKHGKVLVISLLGSIVGKDADKPTDNPLKTIDVILEENKNIERVATIVNFHGDFSSEKRVIGYYLDGRVTGVVGDHWHVPTADAMVLPKGTAHITDVGMCGALHSSLGVKTEVIINRWRDGNVSKNELETSGILQFNAVIIDIDELTGLAHNIVPVHKNINNQQNAYSVGVIINAMGNIKRILVVEDEKPLNQILSLKLTHEGYQVDSAFNGESGLEMITNNEYDLVLLDLITPVMDGFGVLEQLQGKLNSPPIIVLSNLGQVEEKQRSEELGAAGFFIKADTPLSDVVSIVKNQLVAV